MALPGKRFTAYGSAILLVLATLTVTTAATAAASGPKELCGPGSEIDFDPWEFPASPKIDNKWFPLKPGMQYTTDGTVTSAEGTSAHKVVHTVTGLTKVIDGVNTLVMWDRDYSDGELAESELAFFAQSKDGDVWLFGEYPEEYENGEVCGCAQHRLSAGSPRRRPESRCRAVRGPVHLRMCRRMPPRSISLTAAT